MNNKKEIILKTIENNTDHYFIATRKILEKFGDASVVYAIFLRNNSLCALNLVFDFLNKVKIELNLDFKVHQIYKEGDFVEKGKPLFFIEGKFSNICELETLILQKVGFTCTAAYSAYLISNAVPYANFISMGARHFANSEMTTLIDYGISIGSKQASLKKAKGFIGTSVKASSHFFGKTEGLGTMPHSLIGYAGSTLEAAKYYNEVFPNNKLVVLVDYFGSEISDTLEVCNYFKDLVKNNNLSVRIDTNGSRYMEGLNEDKSIKIIEKYAPNILKENLTDTEYNYLVGTGVSIAAIFYLKEQLNINNFSNVEIVASSGFNLEKCKLVGKTKAPVNTIGTGSVIDGNISKTFAVADIISYNNSSRVKLGRETLIKEWENFNKQT